MLEVDYNDKNYDYTKYWYGRDYENSAEFLAIKSFLPKKYDAHKKVIDLGGGFGRLIPILKDKFGLITVADYSTRLLSLAKETGKLTGVNVQTIQCDLNNMSDVIKDKYDYVVMVRVSHHLKDLNSVIEQISSVLPSGGVFILEIANKMHFKSVVKNLLKGNFKYFNNDPVSIASTEVTFLNHNPKAVEEMLHKSGFKISQVLLVSNFRSTLLKKIIPARVLIFFERIFQWPFALFYFGPSIFYKAQKR